MGKLSQIRRQVRKRGHTPGPFEKQPDGSSVAVCQGCGVPLRVTPDKQVASGDLRYVSCQEVQTP